MHWLPLKMKNFRVSWGNSGVSKKMMMMNLPFLLEEHASCLRGACQSRRAHLKMLALGFYHPQAASQSYPCRNYTDPRVPPPSTTGLRLSGINSTIRPRGLQLQSILLRAFRQRPCPSGDRLGDLTTHTHNIIPFPHL